MRKYYLDGEEYNDITDVVDEIMGNADFEDDFDDFLRDEYGEEVEICGEYFDAVEALKELDSCQYDEKLDAWKEGKAEEIENRLNRADVGDMLDICGYEVEITDTDAEMFTEALNNIEFLRTWVKNCPPLYTSKNDEAMECLNDLSAFVGAMEQRIKEEE